MEKEALFVNHKKIFVSAVLFLASAVLYLSLFAVQNSAENQNKIHIIKTDVSQMQAVEIKQPDGKTLLFENDTNGWELTSPEGLDYNKDKADALPLDIAYLIPDKLIEKKPSEMQKYGLDAPVTVTVHSYGSGSESILIGSKTVTGDGYYFYADNNVYTMGKHKAESLMLNEKNVLNPYVLNIDKTLKLKEAEAKISDIAFFADNIPVTVGTRTEDGTWSSGNGELCRKICTALVNIRASEFLDYTSFSEINDIQKQFKIIFVYAQEEQTLLICTDKNNKIYGMTDNADRVFVLPDSGLDFLFDYN